MLKRSSRSHLTGLESRSKVRETALVYVIGGIHGRICRDSGANYSDFRTAVKRDHSVPFLALRGIK